MGEGEGVAWVRVWLGGEGGDEGEGGGEGG